MFKKISNKVMFKLVLVFSVIGFGQQAHAYRYLWSTIGECGIEVLCDNGDVFEVNPDTTGSGVADACDEGISTSNEDIGSIYVLIKDQKGFIVDKKPLKEVLNQLKVTPPEDEKEELDYKKQY